MTAPVLRTLHLYRDNALSDRHMTIKDSDNTTPLYLVSTHTIGFSGHADVEIFVPSPSPIPTSSSASPDTIIAEINLHTFRRRISISLHGTPNEILSKNHNYIFESATGLGRLTWKFVRRLREMSLVDGQGRIVARFEYKIWAGRKAGQLEIMVGTEGKGRVVDEVVVSALAMMELVRRKSSADNS